MKPPPFAFRDPTSLEDALLLLGDDDNARPLAGGQSLVPMLNFRLARPSTLVDLNRIDELTGISIFGQDAEIGARIGAMTRHAEAAAHDGLAALWPLIRAALAFVAHPQIRTRGTIGGSLAHNDPAAELPAVMVALDAVIVAETTTGERRIAAGDFSVAALTTVLEPGEVLTAIDLPVLPAASGHGFTEIARRHGDFALAAAAAVLSRNNGGHARIVVTGMGNGPLRVTAAEQALIATDFSADSLDDVAALVREAVDPVDDLHAPAAYRRKVAGVMAVRACRDAIGRMAGGAA